ncbi:MAG TPA: shikimate kinase [Polyangia bacterium]|jgi:adenylate kinase family enzyme|nr:shikimate kinase [Polyangia bacterium]
MRIVLIGNSGSGKSTLAARLEREHGLARLELDGIVWEPGQIAVPRPAAAAHADLAAFVRAHERWVIEGCDGDLAGAALPAATELWLLNPGCDVCVANNRRRPWEPHKYATAALQDGMLAPLLAWVAAYYTRGAEDPRSYAFHRALFDGHAGGKREITRAGDGG